MTIETVTYATAIDNLKFINCLQVEVIGRLREYEQVVRGNGAEKVVRTGFAHNYESALGYLKQRRAALQAVIRSVEQYAQASTNIGRPGTVHWRNAA